MKHLFKAFCLATALVMVLSMGVFAASISLNTPVTDVATREVTLSGRVEEPAANQQVTVVVLKSTASLSSMTDGDIVYLDQVATAADNSFSVSMKIGAEKGDSFTAYIGGTQVATVSSQSVNLGSAKPGDVTGDGVVDLEDYNTVLKNFGKVTSEGDANGDGRVDIDDYNLVLAYFKK